MWALPNVTSLDAENLPGWLDDHSLWCLLLFPRAEKAILDGLRQNWERFSNALGSNVHVITLLESKNPATGAGLKFPSNYEAQVGRFCHDLQIRLDHLPAIFLLNATDGRGPPYWSLKRDSPQLGSAALETLVSDICASTFNLSLETDPLTWRTTAATRLLDTRSGREALHFAKANRGELLSIAQRLLGGLSRPAVPT